MTQTLRALLPLTLAGLLASCGGMTPTPPAAQAPLSALNEDICPSCGRPSISVRPGWVWQAPAAGLVASSGEGLSPEAAPEWAASRAVAAEARSRGRTLWEVDLQGAPLPKEAPVICVDDSHEERPVLVPALTLALSPFSPGTARNVWTGARLAFSKPVAAEAVQTEAQGQEQCAAEFGPGWRMLRSDHAADALPLGTQALTLWALQTQP
ncbi:hypothetical protein [Deinococcus multiflagellatus]|uniref:hypothetical protein n=1 Tax=Deinococcus multiflagellatus TaxID=1656887 RepID=UPI001CCB8D76|nr:hypothetical protein [Deinococcus multiflagellatus]MBZ9714804.1 hypothetical protein [Deinococcus multiflagellatus]